MHPRLRRCKPRMSAGALRLPATRAPSCALHPDRMADCPPARVSAVHLLRVEAGFAQLDRRLAADVETVRAVHDDRLRFGKLADPVLELLGVPPLYALRDVLPARDGGPRAHVDDLDGPSGGEHLFHFLDADALDVA